MSVLPAASESKDLSRRFRHGRIQGRIDNLTDERYEDVVGVPMPGRWFGLETIFDL